MTQLDSTSPTSPVTSWPEGGSSIIRLARGNRSTRLSMQRATSGSLLRGRMCCTPGMRRRLQAKLVAQGANVPATQEAEAALHARGALVLPDFIANAGGVICAAVEYHGGTEAAAFAAIAEKIGRNMNQVLEQASRTRSMPRTAAIELAEARIEQAAGYRRWR